MADVFVTPHLTLVFSVTARSHITETCVSTAVLCVCNLLMCAENMVYVLSEIIKSSATVINTGSVTGRSITINVTYSKSEKTKRNRMQNNIIKEDTMYLSSLVTVFSKMVFTWSKLIKVNLYVTHRHKHCV